MAYTLEMMRGHARALLNDPNADQLTNNELRDQYLNPAAKDWWRRFEDRPGQVTVGVNWLPGLRHEYLPVQSSDRNQDIYRVTVSLAFGSEELAMRRSEWNRVRFLQETEGGIGIPNQWACLSYANGGFGMRFALYPLASQLVWMRVYSKPSLSDLVADHDALPFDPVAARYVTRLASYRLGIDLGVSDRVLKAILAPFPQWARDELKIDIQLDRKAREEDQAGAQRHLVVGG